MSEKEKEIILSKNGLLLSCIKNPSEELQLKALSNVYGNISYLIWLYNYIKNPSDKIIKTMIEKIQI